MAGIDELLEESQEPPKPPNPMFDIPKETLGIDVDENQKFSGTLGYTVVEKTKNFAILRVEGISMKSSIRKL